MKFWCHKGKHEFESDNAQTYITNLLDYKKGKIEFEFICDEHLDWKARHKEIALMYFERNPDAKKVVIEKGYKLFPYLASPPINDIDIKGIIKKEEELYHEMLRKGERIVKKLKLEDLTGEILCKLHHTHGIDPFAVADILNIIDLPNKLHDDYLIAYEKHRQTGREGLIKEEIKVEEEPLDIIYEK